MSKASSAVTRGDPVGSSKKSCQRLSPPQQGGGGPARRAVERLREVAPDLDETRFHDTLSSSLQRGRFLRLIFGDGISTQVEAIFEHLATQGALHFSFGLVEMPIFPLPEGGHLAVPRVVAGTGVMVREVVALPQAHALAEAVVAGD